MGVQALLDRRSTTAGLLIKPMREPPARIIQVGAKLREFITAPGRRADAVEQHLESRWSLTQWLAASACLASNSG